MSVDRTSRLTRRPTQAVILAGGRGTRLRPLTDTLPKAMIRFQGKPFVEHIIEMLREQGFSSVLLLLGYLPDIFVEHFGDGSRLGLRIDYDITAPDDLTAHRVRVARPKLDEGFLLMYCDNYWPMRMDDMWAAYLGSGAPAQVTVYANEDGYTRSSVLLDDAGMVAVFDRSRSTPGLRGVEIGYAILPRDVVDLLPDGNVLFEEAAYPPLAALGLLHGYWTEHRYYSVGGHDRLPLTEAFFRRVPTVILDRDGVLDRRPPRAEYVRSPDEFHWLPGALDALRILREAGFRVIVVSNQAGINKGAMTAADLDSVTEHMRGEAQAAGGRIDAVYHCPHDWDEGCACRKPRPGMLFAAQREHHLDLSRTWFIGDDDRDRQAADAAGCPFALVDADSSLLDQVRRLVAAPAAQALA